MSRINQQLLRKLPAIESLLQEKELQNLLDHVPRTVMAEALRVSVDQIRHLLTTESATNINEDSLRQSILDRAIQQIQAAMKPRYRNSPAPKLPPLSITTPLPQLSF